MLSNLLRTPGRLQKLVSNCDAKVSTNNKKCKETYRVASVSIEPFTPPDKPPITFVTRYMYCLLAPIPEAFGLHHQLPDIVIKGMCERCLITMNDFLANNNKLHWLSFQGGQATSVGCKHHVKFKVFDGRL